MDAFEEAALELAARQYGVIAKVQALEAGMTEHQIAYRVESRRWLPVHAGVYRLAGAPSTGRQRAMAACLWLGDGAVVSHTSAARLLRLDGIRASSLHVSVPAVARKGRSSSRSFVLHRARTLDLADRVCVDGIPCTSAARTLIDLAGVVGDEALEIAFESARRLGLTSTQQLAFRFAQVGVLRKGSAKVQHLLEHQRAGARALESPLEVKAWRLLRSSGLPLPDRQAPLGAYRVDFLWSDARVVLECDGFEAHAGHLRWKRDRRRQSDIELWGYRMVHVTWDDVTRRPADTIARLQRAITEQRLSNRTR